MLLQDKDQTSTDPLALLHHVPSHRVLICTQCQYAIQPSAISRHLKDIHHIYRGERKALLQHTSTLDLANPEDVHLPSLDAERIPFLPVERGFACDAAGCSHLCVTLKRMKAHWASVHKDAAPNEAQWRQTNVQTFFRGNQLKYFEVHFEVPEENYSGGEKPTIEVPIVSTSDWPITSLDDGLLLEHFKNFTYLDLGHNKGTIEAWRVVIPEIAPKHSYLYHGILACSALHLAHLQPHLKRRYRYFAAQHQSEALPAFRQAIGNPSEDNCNALLAFSQLLMVHSFASEEQDENLLIVDGTSDSSPPEWLAVIKGSCVVYKELWQYIETGPFKSINTAKMRLQPPTGENNEPQSPKLIERVRRLGDLVHLPFTLPSDPETDKLRHTWGVAHLQLSCAFHQAEFFKSEFTIWTAVYLWPAQLSPDYLQLLKNRQPWALILLAHYCILLEPLEGNWYMYGFRRRLVERIRAQLGMEWWKWIQWPMEEVGLEVSGL